MTKENGKKNLPPMPKYNDEQRKLVGEKEFKSSERARMRDVKSKVYTKQELIKFGGWTSEELKQYGY
jgi:hypothetical protein